MAEKPMVPKDPIKSRSMSKPIFIASALLLASLLLSGYDEFWGRRPYKDFQREFLDLYQNHLEMVMPRQEERLAKLIGSATYKDLETRRKLALEDLAAKEPAIVEEVEVIGEDLTYLREVQKLPKSQFSAYKWQAEAAASEDKKQEIIDKLDDLRRSVYPVDLQYKLPGEAAIPGELNYLELEDRILALQNRKAELEKIRGRLGAPAVELKKQMDAYVAKNIEGPLPVNVAKLMKKAEDGLLGPQANSVDDILQIHIREFDWVDRCESCHAGTEEPIDMSLADIVLSTFSGLVDEEKEDALAYVRDWLKEQDEAGRKAFTDLVANPLVDTSKFPEGVVHAVDDIRPELKSLVAFTAHPTKELLKIHPPEQFGCSMCHNGNGRSVTSVELAHGKNKHWLYPLHARENFDAGCVQCHTNDFRLDHAETFNEGRRLFEHKGCWGCHKYQGFNTEPDTLAELANRRKSIDARIEKMETQLKVAAPAERSKIKMEEGRLKTELKEIETHMADLAVQRKRVGPNLKNLRAKVKRDWILPWLLDPASFRPTTKMPSFFRNLPEEQKAAHAIRIAAYIWQNAKDPGEVVTRKFDRGDAAKGKELFKNRGCLGCHTIQLDGKMVGDGFAADLSRIGDKHNYDYTVRWILDPDNGVMPNLRLSVSDAQDIATFLVSQSQGTRWEPTPQLDDPKLAEEGAALVRHYGCAGCHEIAGMENEKGIGTELTTEGSKPKERLDFGRLEHGFKEHGQYTHKHYFENKLREPGIFWVGKVFDPEKNGLDRLRMPNFRLNEKEINALTTFLLGSVESTIPETWRYRPEGRAKDIQQGWWVIAKYNCTGCHQVTPEQTPSLWNLPWFQGVDAQGRKPESHRPPTLVSLGAKANPEWLAEFLRNPALTHDPAKYNGNGVRPYLDVRMPTFRLSDAEIETLVRFFQALDSQPVPYVAPDLKPLNADELAGIRQLYADVKCYQCHAIGDPTWDAKMNAPNLLVARNKLKYDWILRWLSDPSSIVPWTAMPVNFVGEWEVKTTDGRRLIGTDFKWARDGKTARMKLNSGETVRLQRNELDGEPTFLRTVGTTIPKALENVSSDHRDLMARYLLFHYDKSEIDRVLKK